MARWPYYRLCRTTARNPQVQRSCCGTIVLMVPSARLPDGAMSRYQYNSRCCYNVRDASNRHSRRYYFCCWTRACDTIILIWCRCLFGVWSEKNMFSSSPKAYLPCEIAHDTFVRLIMTAQAQRAQNAQVKKMLTWKLTYSNPLEWPG